MAEGADPRPGGVIFDCDGVLVNSEPLTNAILVKSFARHGLTVTEAELEEFFLGGTIARVAERARAQGAKLGEGWVENTYAEIYAALRRGTPEIPGVHGLLDRLDAALVPYAVASNGSMEKMEITLGQTGLWPRFEGRIFSAHVLGTAKPEPGLFLHAAAALGLEPKACVVVEDSATGARAARAAGMRCLGLARTGDGARLRAEGAQVLASLDAVAGALGLDP